MRILPFDQRLQFHLSHQVDQASPEKSTEDLIVVVFFLNDECISKSNVILAIHTCSPTGPGGPGNPLDPSSPFWPNRPC